MTGGEQQHGGGGFRRVEDGRTIIFGAGAIAAAADLVGDGFTLLTTERAQRAVPALTARAGAVVHVPPGLVEDAAAALQSVIAESRLVALGGGRVIDVAKALAAVDPPRTVIAIPTTLSGAEMTGLHRLPRDAPADTSRVRPSVVINDPVLSASAPTPALAASSANALGHALTAMTADDADADTRTRARDAARHIVGAWSGAAAEPDGPELALGALWAGWCVDRSGLGLHHVLAQTAVRTVGLGHAQANLAVLPASIAALRARRPEVIALLEADLGADLVAVVRSLARRAGPTGIARVTGDEHMLALAVEAAAVRPEVGRCGPAPDRCEIRALYRSLEAPPAAGAPH